MNESKALLVEQVRQNDPAAFGKLFGSYYSLVFNRCLQILKHRQDAEDATQETFSRVARYIHQWDPRKPFEPWLIAIAGNRCRTYLSRRRGHQTLSSTNEPASELSTQCQEEQSLREEVTLAVSMLPADQRKAFRLFHEQSMSYSQIALQLGCPVGTAKTWVHRARTNLMKRLQEREVVIGNRNNSKEASA